MKHLLKIFLLTILLIPPCYSQDKTVTFAPFVSRLKAIEQSTSIVLSWQAPSGIKGYNIIYRYTEEITEKNIDKAELITRIDANVESYTDYPPNGSDYFYAILIEDSRKTIHKLFIPFRNKTSTGVHITLVPNREESTADITEIQANAAGDSVTITFKSSNPDRELLLFRNTSPITSEDDLVSSITPYALPAKSVSFIDYPIPGIDYYYAVLDAEQFKIGKFSLVKNENTMSSSVSLPISDDRVGLTEPQYSDLLPLPYLSLSMSVETGKRILSSPYALMPGLKKLSPQTRTKIDNFIKKLKSTKKTEMTPEILPADTSANQSGEAYKLQEIVKNDFIPKRFDNVKIKLSDFLAIEHGEEVSSRANFYYAQASYFTGDYKKAFLHFLLADDKYYPEIQPWLDACFGKFENPANN
jgi:hypothetical protein